MFFSLIVFYFNSTMVSQENSTKWSPPSDNAHQFKEKQHLPLQWKLEGIYGNILKHTKHLEQTVKGPTRGAAGVHAASGCAVRRFGLAGGHTGAVRIIGATTERRRTGGGQR